MFDRAVLYYCKPNERFDEGNFTTVQVSGINKHVFLSSLLLMSFVGLTGLYLAITGRTSASSYDDPEMSAKNSGLTSIQCILQ